MANVSTVISFLQEFAPLSLAADWDNVGLLLGEDRLRVRKVMTCLTITPPAALEAIAKKAQLIVSHHPILFRPVQKLTASNPDSRMLIDLIRNKIAVYSPHTAFDNTRGGINEMLAAKFGLMDVQPLRPKIKEGQFKIVVFVPSNDLSRVMDAMFAAGAGIIGEYRECSYRLEGKGTFFGSDSTNPTVGKKGRREIVEETRLEVVCSKEKLPLALQQMIAAHSYEEPAYDVYPLSPTTSNLGEGRIGILPNAVSLVEFAKMVKEILQARGIKMIGEKDKMIRRVAVACGAAGEFLRDAIRAHADVFVTGEMRFHHCLEAETKGIGVLVPGHFATERPGIEELATIIAKKFPDLEVWPCGSELDPCVWL